MTLQVNVGFESIMQMEVTQHWKRFNFTSLDGKNFIAADISTIMIADDYGIALEEDRVRQYQFQIPEIHAKKQFTYMAASDNTSHWHTLQYDPSFTALFVPDAKPQVPTAKKQNNGAKIAIAVSLSVVAVIVIAAIIAFTFMPSLRRLARPFSERTNNDGRAKTRQSSGAWTRGKVDRTQ